MSKMNKNFLYGVLGVISATCVTGTLISDSKADGIENSFSSYVGDTNIDTNNNLDNTSFYDIAKEIDVALDEEAAMNNLKDEGRSLINDTYSLLSDLYMINEKFEYYGDMEGNYYLKTTNGQIMVDSKYVKLCYAMHVLELYIESGDQGRIILYDSLEEYVNSLNKELTTIKKTMGNLKVKSLN